MKNKINANLGFSLIEMILYIALTSIFITAAIGFALDVIYGRIKSEVQREVGSNLKFIANRINYEIRNASDINSVASDSISLANSDLSLNPTIINFTGGKITLGQGSTGSCPITSPCDLNSDNVEVTNLIFTDLSTSNTSSVKFSLSITHDNPSNRKEWDRSGTYESSVQIRSK